MLELNRPAAYSHFRHEHPVALCIWLGKVEEEGCGRFLEEDGDGGLTRNAIGCVVELDPENVVLDVDAFLPLVGISRPRDSHENRQDENKE